EEFGFATMPLVSMGCLMQRDCHQDTCPVGICTQDECLRGRFAGRPEHVINFMTFVAQDLREHMARLGFRTVEQMVGHPECLRQVGVEGHPKANSCDLSALLHAATPQLAESIDGADGVHFLPQMAADLQLERTLDATLFVPYTASARDHMVPVRFGVDIDNVNRCVGTMLGAAVTAAHPEGLPEGAVTIDCQGSGGQSFGAFLPRGITLNIEGDANDYVGKGLSGGIVSVRPNARSTYKFDENVSVGNVAFYGATSGKGFVNGLAGQRFGVRNSGATLVVEGVGNHGCEYMTGGVAVVLGEVGSNFAAGMSGGVAYVYDELRTLDGRCNHDMVDLVQPTDAELERVRELIEEHVHRTSSPRGIKLLYQFADVRRHFVKVMPHEYRLIMEQADREQVRGVSREKAVELAFESLRREA
ncbi:MAG: glutamate synthase-related protein, partial [Atopobiaceae bacterium]|nr:glutamate synthase-related protein [Atopobiaceae bacterium]